MQQSLTSAENRAVRRHRQASQKRARLNMSTMTEQQRTDSLTLTATRLAFWAVPGFTDNEFIAAGYYEQEESFIPAYIRSQFTPWSACLISAIPMFFFWYTMVLVILLCSMMGHPMLAPSLYGFILLAPTTLLTECLPSWLVLPTDFNSLGAIVSKCVGGELSHLGAVLIGYLAVDIGLIIILYRIALHTDFSFFDQK